MRQYGVRALMLRSTLEIVRRPLYWVGFFMLPLFLFLFLADLFSPGLPIKVPAAIVDKDGSALSRQLSLNLGGMQMVDLVATPNSYTDARHLMQEGKIYGYFLIPENFEEDILSGRDAEVTFYTNMTFFVPAELLFKTFKITATYAKAGILTDAVESVGINAGDIKPLIMPVNIQNRPLNNPQLNYGIYLCNSFIPAALQLMIFLVTCFSLGQEIKYHTSVELMHMAGGSIVKALFGKLLPQTVIWVVIALFMESWLFKFNGFPMHGSWGWITLSEVMFVLACQGMGLAIFGLLPNLRLSLSISALTGILTFSIAAFSFPVESMYGGVAIFSWIVPTRYNFLIYIDQALNGIHIYYSRIWFVAYIIFMILPLPFLPRMKRYLSRPVYCP